MIYLRALGAYWNEYSRSNSELIKRGEGKNMWAAMQWVMEDKHR